MGHFFNRAMGFTFGLQIWNDFFFNVVQTFFYVVGLKNVWAYLLKYAKFLGLKRIGLLLF